jgi:hypothetical protein
VNKYKAARAVTFAAETFLLVKQLQRLRKDVRRLIYIVDGIQRI